MNNRFVPRSLTAVFLVASAWLCHEAGSAEWEPPRATADAGPARPQRIGNYPHHEHHPTKKWIARLHSEPVSYTLQHWACYDKSHAPQAIALEGQIGMLSPGGGNWYQNGFFNFALDDTLGRNYAVKAVRAVDSGERASVEFVWELPQAWVRVRFLVVPGKDPLFCSLRQYPKTDHVPRLKASLVCYPSGYFHRGDRAAVTPLRTLSVGARVDLSPTDEWSLILYDRKYDLGVDGGIGGCGAITVPAPVGRAKLELGSYGCTWTVEGRPGAKELRFAFWAGLKKKNTDLVPSLTNRFPATLRDLRQLDFRPLRFRQDHVARIKAEFERLQRETPGSRPEAAAFRATLAALDRLRDRVTGPAPDLQAEDDYLATLKRLENLLWQLRMKWVFSD